MKLTHNNTVAPRLCLQLSNAGWTAQLACQPTWGGTYNSQRDRSTAQANVGYQF